MKADDFKGKKVTIMGLGLHGGGLASTLFFLKRGAAVTVTDLKSEQELASSLEKLKSFPVRFVLGRHEVSDFTDTDIVVKSPAVPADSELIRLALQKGVRVETDISLFLSSITNPVIAVTGSKGKSTTASAIHFCLKSLMPGAQLGGNITVSPFEFLDDLSPGAPVVLELSSWQLADLKGRGVLKPKVALITNILPDHMNRYSSMESYIEDKAIIFENQSEEDFTLLNRDNPDSVYFTTKKRGKTLFFSAESLPSGVQGAWLSDKQGHENLTNPERILLNERLLLKGEHNRLNLLSAGLACVLLGLAPSKVRPLLSRFPGIEHRLEKFAEHKGVSFYNDSAATIPHAVIEALKSLPGRLILLTGGTDKNIDFEPLGSYLDIPEQIYLLEGTATQKIKEILDARHIPYNGLYSSLDEALQAIFTNLHGRITLLFSPGCASFGMFKNEFDRGRQFKEKVLERIKQRE